jgi:hypothetical protein
MLPPVAEVYVVWHPDDRAGGDVAGRLIDHFHGTPFTGLIGGAVEVFARSVGWRWSGDAPRPIPFPGAPPPNGLREAQFVAVVPVLGTELAAAVEPGAGTWHDYATGILAGHRSRPDRVGIFPLMLDRTIVDGTRIGEILGRFQRIGQPPVTPLARPDMRLCSRDLAQGLAQLADHAGRADPAGPDRLTVFISHTKVGTGADQADVSELVSLVRLSISETRLRDFFDARDLQPGTNWSEATRTSAATSAMLAVRTDHYASRAWCQEEMLLAKRAGMPVVILDALRRGDERGSFLMDHVPRMPVRRTVDGWPSRDIVAGLDLLVDECLKRALWRHQRRLAAGRPDLEFAWWAPHAPEPVTFVDWLAEQRTAGRLDPTRPLRILHPDPPLGPDELRVLEQISAVSGVDAPLEIMTPRSLAARGYG